MQARLHRSALKRFWTSRFPPENQQIFRLRWRGHKNFVKARHVQPAPAGATLEGVPRCHDRVDFWVALDLSNSWTFQDAAPASPAKTRGSPGREIEIDGAMAAH